MLGDIACETGVAVESAPVLRTKSSQNKAPVASKKPKKFDAFAYSAPPPVSCLPNHQVKRCELQDSCKQVLRRLLLQAAAMMDFDDEPAAPAQVQSCTVLQQYLTFPHTQSCTHHAHIFEADNLVGKECRASQAG